MNRYDIWIMKLKLTLLALLMLYIQHTQANMASPFREGTETGSAISSKDINILSEKIFIKVGGDLKTATFIVEYNIESQYSGFQIPLLFHAEDFKDSFLVWVDEHKVQVRDIPFSYNQNPAFSGFSEALENDVDGNDTTIYWQKNVVSRYKKAHLKYFEADIGKGVHKIRVQYTANSWRDLSGWVQKISYRYSLTPARYWKSFGSLEIIVQQNEAIKKIKSNFGQPNETQIKNTSKWTFNKLPGETFELSITPKVNGFAIILMTLQPFGLCIIATMILAIIHLKLIYYYKQNNAPGKHSAVLISGSVIIPFISLLAYMYSYNLIDYAIGEAAGKLHGYVFVVMILYPIFFLLYWLTILLIDRFCFKKTGSQKTIQSG